MTAVYLDLILTGACPRSCYGKHISLTAPLHRTDHALTTIADVVTMLHNKWPEELQKVHAADGNSVGCPSVKVLKAGRLLALTDTLQGCLTRAELVEAAAHDTSPRDATPRNDKTACTRASALMHLVVQPAAASPSCTAQTSDTSTKKDVTPAAAVVPLPSPYGQMQMSTPSATRAPHAPSHGRGGGGSGSEAAPPPQERPEVKSDYCCNTM